MTQKVTPVSGNAKRSLFAMLTFGLFVAWRWSATARKRWHTIRHDSLPTASDLKKTGLSQATYDKLPRHSNAANGQIMESMNYILAGDPIAIAKAFSTAGWYAADHVSPLSLTKAFGAIVFSLPYLHGPFTPLFVGAQTQDLNFQKPTGANKFRQRHHTRIWQTDLTDLTGQRLWIAQASFDTKIKRFAIPPGHEIDPDIDTERDVVVHDLVKAGGTLRGYVQFQEPHQRTNAFGDTFQTDGRAAVVAIENEKG